MPGVDLRGEPPPATDSPPSDEASHLQLQLQRQLEEDIARIFDESIYSDLEVVCGKLKLLTHSCILKARTNKFYHKLESILDLKLARSTFDEIYSFISDTYTECDIKHQEKEILAYLKTIPLHSTPTKEDTDEAQGYSTAKCVSPNPSYSKEFSPNTDLTKEYYALLPIDGNLLERELREQEVLSNCFQSIIKTQGRDLEKFRNLQRNKPSTLTIGSSHSSKTTKHSGTCDKLEKNHPTNNILSESDKCGEKSNKKSSQSNQNSNDSTIREDTRKNVKHTEVASDVSKEATYSPDSLMTDDLSSASDYLSAAYSCTLSPERCIIEPTHTIVNDSVTVMEHLIKSYDSGLENTGLFESLTSHKDVTLTDTSLTESTLHDLSNYNDSSSVPLTETDLLSTRKSENIEKPCSSSKKSPDSNSQDSNEQCNENEIINCNSSKQEKQRQNEEIVILESSSLSSETGSWESVFPPKLTPQDVCEKFILNERQHHSESKHEDSGTDLNYKDNSPGLVQKSPFKSTSCFIDAASLVEEEDEVLSIHVKHDECLISTKPESIASSEPSKCSALKDKSDLSPNDWSENDNDDSIDTDSIQKDLSAMFFVKSAQANQDMNDIASTPNNSMLSVGGSSSQYNDSDFSSDILITYRSSVRQNSSEAVDINKPPQATSSRSWVVNMSPATKEIGEVENNVLDTNQKTETNKTSDSLRNSAPYTSTPENGNKSRSSVESDGCEKSSHKFYVDLSSLPDVEPSKNKSDNESANEKKNMFSMFIGFDEKTTLKEMPSRLNAKKAAATKGSPQKVKLIKEANDSTSPQNTSNKSDDTKSPITFEIYEVLCKDPKFTISEIIRLHEKIRKDGLQTVPDDIKNEHNKDQEKNSKSSQRHEKQSKSNRDQEKQSKSMSADCSSRPVIKDEKANLQEDALFVKLSDLDKPVSKTDTLVGKTEQRTLDERMTRSIPENNWSDQNQASSSRSNEVISSFHSENTLSLNRLFPHLRNEFSRSMPGSLSTRSRLSHRLDDFSRGETDDQASETSDMSSVQSSFCPSIVENSTTEETSQASSLIGNCQSRLGQDLLRMFLEEIAPDVIVEVSGRRIKAHKCILSSRCQYFAGILSGGWVESAGNVISLPTFSFNVVHFALCHIYSGVSTIPDTISIVELATLADMLGLEGLKEAIMFTLKAKYCHHFHRPCAVCKAGILECLTLASVYGLDELYRKCLKWITKYFSAVWPTKAFATLPSELLDKCYHQLIIELTLDNCVDTAYGCGITVSLLNSSRWSEVIIRMCHRVARAIANFMAPKLVTVLRNIEMLPPDPPYCAVQALDECIRAAIAWAPPEELCRAYEMIAHSINEKLSHRLTRPDVINNGKIPEPDNLLHAQATLWFSVCEKAIVKDATRVCNTQAYRDLPSDLRNRLQSLGCIQRPSQPSVLSPSHNRRNRSNQGASQSSHGTSRSQSSAANSSDIDQMRASFVPYSLKPLPPGTQQILQEYRKTSRTISPKVRTTKAQEERARFNLTKTTLSQERLNTKSPSKSYENAKPRYLESRGNQEFYKKLSQSLVMPHKFRSSIKLRPNDEPAPEDSSHTSTDVQARSHDSLACARREPPAQASQDKLLTPTRYRRNTKTQTLPECSAPIRPRDEGPTQLMAHDNLASASRSRHTVQNVPRDISVATAQILPQDNLAVVMSPRMKVRAHTSRALNEVSVQIVAQDSTAISKPRVDPQTLSPKLGRNVTKTQYSTLSQRNDVQKTTRSNIVQENQANLMGACNDVEASSSNTSVSSSRPGNKPNEHKALSQDSLATSSKPHTPEPSTESLSESQNSNIYATYTKVKHHQKDVKPAAASRKVTRAQTRAANPRVKSKIPVYFSQTSKPLNKQITSDSHSVGSHSLSTSAATTATTSSVQSRSKIHDKPSSSNSLMNATKSSSAKMVTKVVKDNSRLKLASKNKAAAKRPQRREEKTAADIPVMERSGTFLKDEPTFGDRPHLFDANDSDQDQ